MRRPEGEQRVAHGAWDLAARPGFGRSPGQGQVTSCCGLRAVPTRSLSVTFSSPTYLFPLTDRNCDLLWAARPCGPALACRESVSPRGSPNRTDCGGGKLCAAWGFT